MPDGSVLFTEQDAGDGQLVKIDKDDKISVFVQNTNRTIGLAYDTKGPSGRDAVEHPARRGAVSDAHDAGGPSSTDYLSWPKRLVADTKGGMYFTDTLSSRFRPTPPSRTKPGLSTSVRTAKR